jgi:hypothetical protein
MKGGDRMACQYNYPYNQDNTGYMTAQNGMQQQAPVYQKNMQTEAPRGTTPLARSLPPVPGSITGPTPQTIPIAGQIPAVTSAISPIAGSVPMGMGTETPITVQSPYYTAGFLRNFIGKNVRVEFLLGTAGSTSDRVGTLLEVGASYIVLQPLLTDDLLMCDLYSIRFVTIIL